MKYYRSCLVILRSRLLVLYIWFSAWILVSFLPAHLPVTLFSMLSFNLCFRVPYNRRSCYFVYHNVWLSYIFCFCVPSKARHPLPLALFVTPSYHIFNFPSTPLPEVCLPLASVVLFTTFSYGNLYFPYCFPFTSFA